MAELDRIGGVDCDMHPRVPGIDALIPFLPPYWAASVVERGMPGLESLTYPPRSPLSSRPDWREAEAPPCGVERYRERVLDRYGFRNAIAHCLYGVHMMPSADMAVAFASAVNQWMAATWLDAEPRMRASIVVAWQDPERAVDEIRRCAPDRRFVQILLPAMAEAPLGRRSFWPIYREAEALDLPIGVHPGGAYRFPVTPVGWPSFHIEDYASQSMAFQGQLGSLIAEGVFTKFPGLRVVLIESGVSWFTPFLWRLTKFWRGARGETPWIDRPPIEIARDHVRLTTQPFDTPVEPEVARRVIDALRSDEVLLLATDYPHWQFDDDEVVPPGVDGDALVKMARDNPLKTYPRLEEAPA